MGDFNIGTWIKYLITGIYINLWLWKFEIKYDAVSELFKDMQWELFLATSLLVGVFSYFIFRTVIYEFIQKYIIDPLLGKRCMRNVPQNPLNYFNWLTVNDCWEYFQEIHKNEFKGSYNTWRSSIIMFYTTGLFSIGYGIFNLISSGEKKCCSFLVGISITLIGLWSEWKYQRRLGNIALNIVIKNDENTPSNGEKLLAWNKFRRDWNV